MALSLVRRRRIIEILTTFVICSVLLGGCTVGSNTLEGATTPLPAGVLPKFAHVFVIMLENRGYTQVMDNPHAPYINQLATTYGLATKYTGVAHPSQPNYLAAISGSTSGVYDDNDVTLHARNLVDQ